MSPQAAAPAARGTLRAWAEVLRAPLLLSPAADVLAGWCVAFEMAALYPRTVDGAGAADLWRLAVAGGGHLLRAALAGTCLLADGMAQNALVDLPDDRRRKPGRPLPRGALRPGAVRAAQYGLWLAALALAASVGNECVVPALLIVVLTAAYHALLKSWRLPGCLALGALRGLDLFLGAAALHAWSAQAQARGLPASRFFHPDLDSSVIVAAIYALYMTGASLHASTDDEPGRSPWSPGGLWLSTLALMFLGCLVIAGMTAPGRAMTWSDGRWVAAIGVIVVLAAIVRLARAWRHLPPPALTGVALSGLYLFDAAACFGSGLVPLGLLAGAAVLLLFGASRLLLRTFPPT